MEMFQNYTAPEVLLLIAAIGAVVVNAITAWKNADRIEQTLQKTAVIEGHVNSRETQYVEQIASLQREMKILQGIITEKEKTAGLLAQAVVQGVTIQGTATVGKPAAAPPEPVEVIVTNEPLAVTQEQPSGDKKLNQGGP